MKQLLTITTEIEQNIINALDTINNKCDTADNLLKVLQAIVDIHNCTEPSNVILAKLYEELSLPDIASQQELKDAIAYIISFILGYNYEIQQYSEANGIDSLIYSLEIQKFIRNLLGERYNINSRNDNLELEGEQLEQLFNQQL